MEPDGFIPGSDADGPTTLAERRNGLFFVFFLGEGGAVLPTNGLGWWFWDSRVAPK